MICGVDEAGRGPVIGPLVVAGVIFKSESILIENNVRDSKQITPKRREKLENIIKEYAEKFALISISASDIDDMRNVMTLNEIEVNAFIKIIQKLKPSISYVDSADVNDKRFGNNILSRLNFKIDASLSLKEIKSLFKIFLINIIMLILYFKNNLFIFKLSCLKKHNILSFLSFELNKVTLFLYISSRYKKARSADKIALQPFFFK